MLAKNMYRTLERRFQLVLGVLRMKVLAVDDEQAALSVLTMSLQEADPSLEIASFMSAQDCLAFCSENGCPNIAFLDICIGSNSGIELARELKRLNPYVNVVFSTAYSEYAPVAFGVRASGYLLKPITSDMVAAELENLRFPVTPQHKGLYVQTFGQFELFYDGKPVVFDYDKTKEMFAYLFDRQGSLCSNKSIMVSLWETEGHDSYFKRLRKDLVDTLAKIGQEGVLIRHRGSIGLDVSQVTSDFQEFKDGVPSAINSYHGEYMAQYSWAESTNGMLW